MLQEVEVAVNVDARPDQPVPVNALQLDVRIVLLEVEVNSLEEVDVGPLDGVHVLACHFELVVVEILWKHLHIYY